MVSNERAEQIIKIFQCEPQDIVKFIAAQKLTIEDLEYLLNHSEGDEEIKNQIRRKLNRRSPGRMRELLRYFPGESRAIREPRNHRSESGNRFDLERRP